MISFTDDNNVNWFYHEDTFFNAKLLVDHSAFFFNSSNKKVVVTLPVNLVKKFESLIHTNNYRIIFSQYNPEDKSMVYTYTSRH